MAIKIIRSGRKSLSLSVDDELNVVVRAPYSANDALINDFVSKNSQWISKAIERKKAYLSRVNITDNEVESLIRQAKDIIPKRVDYFSSIMNIYPTGIKITKAKKRFGSCNQKNSLCFSCFLMQYPLEAVDYVVVHELAHIRHHNHSAEFYSLIRRYMPDYKQREKLLKEPK